MVCGLRGGRLKSGLLDDAGPIGVGGGHLFGGLGGELLGHGAALGLGPGLGGLFLSGLFSRRAAPHGLSRGGLRPGGLLGMLGRGLLGGLPGGVGGPRGLGHLPGRQVELAAYLAREPCLLCRGGRLDLRPGRCRRVVAGLAPQESAAHLGQLVGVGHAGRDRLGDHPLGGGVGGGVGSRAQRLEPGAVLGAGSGVGPARDLDDDVLELILELGGLGAHRVAVASKVTGGLGGTANQLLTLTLVQLTELRLRVGAATPPGPWGRRAHHIEANERAAQG